MANTFDTSRVGGGTYELELDSTGNYKLKSVGFEAVNKLNLPDLKTSDVTTPPVATIPKQPDVADPFKKLGTQNTGGGEGGGQDYSGVMLKTPEAKDVSVRDAGQPMTKIDTGKTDGKFLASGAAGGASLQGDKASDPFLSSGAQVVQVYNLKLLILLQVLVDHNQINLKKDLILQKYKQLPHKLQVYKK
jgi:hypothetical protein